LYDSLVQLKNVSRNTNELSGSVYLRIEINHVMILLLAQIRWDGRYCKMAKEAKEVATENLELLSAFASSCLYRGEITDVLYQFWLVFWALRRVRNLEAKSLDIGGDIRTVYNRLLRAFNLTVDYFLVPLPQ
jgi:hypothetical protein